MLKHTLLGIALSLTMLAAALQASAQGVPNVKGLEPFSSQTRYMSLDGFLRWQMFKQNKTWISIAEASELVKTQLGGTE